jgi:hypothetical protein
MRHQIEFLDSAAATFTSGGKVIVPKLLFSAVEFSFKAVALRDDCAFS